MRNYQDWMLVERGHVVYLTLDRAENMNTMTIDTLHELRDICSSLTQREDIWVVVIQGEGDHFSSGVAPSVFKELMISPREELLAHIADQQRCMDALEDLAKITIARVQGFCLGGGLIMALCCDFRIASERSIFSLPEAKLGIPITWGTMRVARAVGIPRAKELIILAKKYRASQAYQLGLVHQVVSPENLDRAVDELVNRLLQLPARTSTLTKQILAKGVQMSISENQAMELDLFAEIVTTSDIREAIESYLTQHSPLFSGE